MNGKGRRYLAAKGAKGARLTLTTKDTKITKFMMIDYQDLRTTNVQNLRSLRKFLGNRKLGLGYSSRQDAKSAKFGQDFFLKNFAAFASLREIFRDLVAALPRWVLRGEKQSVEKWQCVA
jgi:hypothetical protein